MDEKMPEEKTVDTNAVSKETVATDHYTGTSKGFNIRAYVGMVIVIIAIGIGLIFLLEKEGRINTGLFAGLIEKIEANKPAAIVNNANISKSDFESSLKQLAQMSAGEGVDMTNPEVNTQLRTQAIETLINGELLRQTAIAEGVIVTTEQIEGRYNEIRDGIGGAETLLARMAEFNVTEESLRRDIENEFLIQGLFGVKISTSTIEVSEEEILALYEQAGGVEAGLPPLSDVREQIIAQIRFDKEQTLINSYIQELRSQAEIEILI